MDPTAFLALLTLGALGLSMAVEDHRTTYVALWKLLAFTGMALAWAATSGALAHNRADALLGALVAGTVGLATAWALERRLTRDALGAADVWILAGGGAVLGLQWLGPWIGLAVVLGVLAFPIAARPDAEGSDQRMILPFVPILLIALTLLAVGRTTGVLPSTPF